MPTPGPLLHVEALLTCPHQAKVVAPSAARVQVSGKPVLTVLDIPKVAACPFQVPAGPGTKPQPCVMVKVTPSTRVAINFVKAVILTPDIMCRSIEGIPQGPPNASGTQTRAIAT
jgi:hypothetical protein